MLARARLALIVLAVAAAPSLALAQTPVESARALVARYHEDPTGIDRARALLEAAVARDPQVDTMVMLSFVHFLYGDVRATTTEDKLAAYDRGREIGKRAVELAPKNPEAHVWYGINTGRWGLTKGVMRSLFLLPTVRQEVDATLALDPRNLRALALSGNVFLEVPGLFGGDREKAVEAVESELLKALKPEFLNRIDNRIVFDGLTRKDMDTILDIQLQRVRGMLANRDLELEVTPAARTLVADLGYDPAFGARPLKRAITTHLLNPMSSAITPWRTVARSVLPECYGRRIDGLCVRTLASVRPPPFPAAPLHR
jgi:hypothetical protein